MTSDARIIRMILPDAEPQRIDLGNYRHTRLQMITGGGEAYLSTSAGTANMTGGFMLPVGAADIGSTNAVNLDGLNGVYWLVGNGAAYVAVMQWGGL